ncbi:uncharacterized protein [Atheta coriaria]|uniref:uncharacterized protein n=1 Tax=Dalotia coriaria TaxID=877792 RepID=UPI0031F3FAB4
MATVKAKVITGLPLHHAISQEALGVQLYQRLKANYHTESPAMINVVSNETLSFRNLFVMTCKLGEWMRRQGLTQNDVILMCCENVMEYFVPVIAAMYSCIIVANANPAYSERELQHAINLSKPKLIFCSKANYAKFHRIRNYIRVIILDDVYELVKSINIDPLRFIPKHCNVYDQTAVILFSSGTSGLFKAVMLTHQNYNARINQAQDPRLSTTTGDSVILFLPFFHAYGFAIILSDLFHGKCVHFMHKFEISSFLSAIDKHKITMLPVVPPVLIMLSKSALTSKYNLTSVVNILCGAAPLSAETEVAIRKIFPNAIIRQGYGLTEGTFAATLFYAKDLDTKHGSVGTAMPGTEIIVRDPDTGALMGPHQVGEFCIKAQTVMKGYLGNPEATKNTFTDDGFLRSGDMCYYDEDGYIYIVDRLKELIKYKAFQIAPAELEALLVTHPKILDAAVIGKPDDVAGEVPLAFVVPRSEGVTEQEIIKFVKDNAAAYKSLRGGVRFLKSIPKSVSGKILRRELRELIKTQSHL